jgi:hypothetical protein
LRIPDLQDARVGGIFRPAIAKLLRELAALDLSVGSGVRGLCEYANARK